MATKIRLQRHGRKSYAFYSIVIADVRAPRDGKFIEKIGTYNPNTNPATVDLKFDRALDWVLKGAQPDVYKRQGCGYARRRPEQCGAEGYGRCHPSLLHGRNLRDF